MLQHVGDQRFESARAADYKERQRESKLCGGMTTRPTITTDIVESDEPEQGPAYNVFDNGFNVWVFGPRDSSPVSAWLDSNLSYGANRKRNRPAGWWVKSEPGKAEEVERQITRLTDGKAGDFLKTCPKCGGDTYATYNSVCGACADETAELARRQAAFVLPDLSLLALPAKTPNHPDERRILYDINPVLGNRRIVYDTMPQYLTHTITTGPTIYLPAPAVQPEPVKMGWEAIFTTQQKPRTAKRQTALPVSVKGQAVIGQGKKRGMAKMIETGQPLVLKAQEGRTTDEIQTDERKTEEALTYPLPEVSPVPFAGPTAPPSAPTHSDGGSSHALLEWFGPADPARFATPTHLCSECAVRPTMTGKRFCADCWENRGPNLGLSARVIKKHHEERREMFPPALWCSIGQHPIEEGKLAHDGAQPVCVDCERDILAGRSLTKYALETIGDF